MLAVDTRLPPRQPDFRELARTRWLQTSLEAVGVGVCAFDLSGSARPAPSAR